MTPDQAAALHFQMQAVQPVLPTPEKKWYDRIVDSILGDDPCESTRLSVRVHAQEPSFQSTPQGDGRAGQLMEQRKHLSQSMP